MNSTTEMKYVEMKCDEISKNETVYPCRLVFIQIQKNCMFCTTPKGESYTQYVNLPERMGYIYCEDCKELANKATQHWKENIAFGEANYLRDRDIKIKRTSGVIESGWELHSPFTHTNDQGIEMIQCYHKTQDMARWCKLEEILELNPKSN